MIINLSYIKSYFKYVLMVIQYLKYITKLSPSISLSMVVLNSRDQQGKLWLPQFSHFQQPPY